MPPQTFLLLPGSFTHSLTRSLTHSFNKHFFVVPTNMPSTGEGYHSELNKHTSCPRGAYNLVKSYRLQQMIRRKRSVSYGSILKGGPLSPGGHRVPHSLPQYLRPGPGVPSSVRIPFWWLSWTIYFAFEFFSPRCHLSVMPLYSMNHSQRWQSEGYQRLFYKC